MSTSHPKKPTSPKARLWTEFLYMTLFNVTLLGVFTMVAWLVDPPPLGQDAAAATAFMDGLRFGGVEGEDGATGYDSAAELMSQSFRANDGVVRLVEEMDDLTSIHGLALSCKPREHVLGSFVHRKIVFDVECAGADSAPSHLVATVSLYGEDGTYRVEGIEWSEGP